MLSPETLAYFSAPKGHLWEWEYYDGWASECIIWSGRSKEDLIIFSRELGELLQGTFHGGLPPLGSLLLVIGAMSGSQAIGQIRELVWEASQRATGDTQVSAGIPPLWQVVGAGLHHIQLLPPEDRSGVPAKIKLLQTLFGNFNGTLPGYLTAEKSKLVVDEFHQSPQRLFQQSGPGINGIARLLQDLSVLEKAFQRCPPESLLERLRTGLDELPSQPLLLPWSQPDETPVPEPPADLLQALEKEGGELALVAGIVRRMGALLHVPKSVTQREELPLGGVSDITNRGDPSRLLMTELAWDDLTFAVRLSQGEALYLRRESPPAEPPPRRLLLLDNGIFLWGKPRLFTLGAAMALLRQKVGVQTAVSNVFTFQDHRFTPVTLETVNDVRAQLTRLEPQPHPGAALALLHSAEDSPFSGDQEVFLLTHPAALETLTTLPIWQKLAQQVPLYTLVVDRDGSLELSRHSPAGARVLSKARVEAEDLFAPPKPKAKTPAKPKRALPSLLTDEAGRLPEFYRSPKWPLLHPSPPVQGETFEVPNRGYIGCSAEGCVCWWERAAEIGQVLLYRKPASKFIMAVADDNDPDWHLLVFRDGLDRFVEIALVSIKTFECTGVYRVEVGTPDILFPCLNSGCLVVHMDDRSDAWRILDDAVKAATWKRPVGMKGWPAFDGSKFHDNTISSAPAKSRDPAQKIPAQNSQRRILRSLSRVGFSSNGRLLIETEGGHIFQLHTHSTNGPEWVGCHVHGAGLAELQPVDSARWQVARLTIALFKDGRRIVYDPLGYLHVCDSGDDGAQISLTLVRGHTAAWTPNGKFFGEVNLYPYSLFNYMKERLSPMSEFTPLTHKVFRPVITPPALATQGPAS